MLRLRQKIYRRHTLRLHFWSGYAEGIPLEAAAFGKGVFDLVAVETADVTLGYLGKNSCQSVRLLNHVGDFHKLLASDVIEGQYNEVCRAAINTSFVF